MELFNTASGKLEQLQVEGKDVSIYVCGPTVYNYIHIGNARPVLFFDVVRNYLEFLGYDVTLIQNFTDIDDKIIDAAEKENLTIVELADRYIQTFLEDADSLNVSRATIYPKATDTIPEIIDLINDLVVKGFAYAADDGVYFKVSQFKEYGKLSGRKLEDMIPQEALRASKESEHDFALWKREDRLDISWTSPWGRGRPGWHIECSAMIKKTVGCVDIHGGGQDLIFPHHENEIAQSEASTDKTLARYWMHNGFVNVKQKKMSKSQDNYFLVRNAVKKYGANALRMFLLTTHYRKPLQFSLSSLDVNKSAFDRMEGFVKRLEIYTLTKDGIDLTKDYEILKKNFSSAMEDDFNTAGAIGALFESVRKVNGLFEKEVEEKSFIEYKRVFLQLFSLLGFKIEEETLDLSSQLISLLIEVRNRARYDKDFATSDLIRDRLVDLGIQLKDEKDGTTWSKR